MDERALTERLITYDTSNVDGLRAASGFIKGWLEAREIDVVDHKFGDLHALSAVVGPPEGSERATVVFHGHFDVVRGRFVCVPDEESEDIERRTSDDLVRRGLVGDFAITGEPTNLHVGIQAKGVLACRLIVHGRAAHGSTPWLGDNAVLKAIDVFRRIESLPFSRESSELFDRPSINLGRISGGEALNMVPDECQMVLDIRYLPNQDPGDILEQIRTIPDMQIARTFIHPPAHVSR